MCIRDLVQSFTAPAVINNFFLHFAASVSLSLSDTGPIERGGESLAVARKVKLRFFLSSRSPYSVLPVKTRYYPLMINRDLMRFASGLALLAPDLFSFHLSEGALVLVFSSRLVKKNPFFIEIHFTSLQVPLSFIFVSL